VNQGAFERNTPPSTLHWRPETSLHWVFVWEHSDKEHLFAFILSLSSHRLNISHSM